MNFSNRQDLFILFQRCLELKKKEKSGNTQEISSIYKLKLKCLIFTLYQTSKLAFY